MPVGIESWIVLQIVLGLVMLVIGVLLAVHGKGMTAGAWVALGLGVICLIGAVVSSGLVVTTSGGR